LVEIPNKNRFRDLHFFDEEEMVQNNTIILNRQIAQA
jgi:hypothetical protein